MILFLAITGSFRFLFQSVISDEQLKSLRSDLRESNLSACAEGTRRNLKIQWESFVLFCVYFNLEFLPVSTQTLQLYAQFLSRSFKSVSSVRNYISGVRTIHQLLGYRVDSINQYLINFTLRGLSRIKSHTIVQAKPITPLLLFKIFQSLDFHSAENVVYWCLFLFAFFLLARKSNLVPTVLQDVSNHRCLWRSDVSYFDGNLVVILNWSKTIQFGERILEVPLLKLPGSPLCPVNAYSNMLKMVKGKSNDCLFLLPGGRPITYYLFQKKLRSVLTDIGIDGHLYSSHSFRRGFATLAFRNNISSDEIQLLGDWKSEAYKRYISLEVSDKLNIISEMSHLFYF